MRRIISILVIATVIFTGVGGSTGPSLAKSNEKVSLKNVTYYNYLSKAKNKKYRAKVKKIAKKALKYSSDYERALFFHDYLCKNCCYDYYNYYRNSVPKVEYTGYSALVKGKAVCSGYSYAYMDLCTAVGIKCKVLSSKGFDHAWNGVWINGKRYLVDVTWDDYDDYSDVAFGHQYFLESNKSFGEDHPRKKGYNNKKYDNDPIDSANGDIYRNGNYYYYVMTEIDPKTEDVSTSLVRQKTGTLKAEKLVSSVDDLSVPNGSLGGLIYKNHCLFVMTDWIAGASYLCSIKMDGTGLTQHFMLKDTNNIGIFTKNGKYYEANEYQKPVDITKEIAAIEFEG